MKGVSVVVLLLAMTVCVYSAYTYPTGSYPTSTKAATTAPTTAAPTTTTKAPSTAVPTTAAPTTAAPTTAAPTTAAPTTAAPTTTTTKAPSTAAPTTTTTKAPSTAAPTTAAPTTATPTTATPTTTTTKAPTTVAPTTTTTTTPTTTISGTTVSAIISGILSSHNTARAAVGVAALIWNNTLATYAANYAAGCVWAHSGGIYGENIYANAPESAPSAANAEAGVSSWVSEQANFDCADNTCAAGDTCGHYTQVVWSGTTSVGCGLVECAVNSPFGTSFPTWNFMVCDYWPAGNYVGERPFPTTEC